MTCRSQEREDAFRLKERMSTMQEVRLKTRKGREIGVEGHHTIVFRYRGVVILREYDHEMHDLRQQLAKIDQIIDAAFMD
jgi:hypothetical protein